ncbi:hypothetical protein RHOSPDRAFT_36882 [Rhodotorula sp. JG-1b]|nr:hypothetical protein RHOSPDRAFT_36882 [Rhodotorula sp. JG-1b]
MQHDELMADDNAYVEALERQALACEEDNARLRAEIAAIEAELAQPRQQLAEDRPGRGSRRLRDVEYTVAHLEATLSVIETSPALDRLSQRDKLVAEAEALTRLAETVTGLETALAWTEARKLDAEALLERDRVYLNDAETMHAVFAERIEQAQAVEPLPPPDGREIVRRTRLRLAELDRRFDLLQIGLRDLIDHVLVDERADERFDPRWAEADRRRRRRRRMVTASTTRDGAGVTVNGDRGYDSKFDLRRYLRATDLAPSSSSSSSSSSPHLSHARDAAAVSEERVREFKLLLETLLNRSLEKTSSAASHALAFVATDATTTTTTIAAAAAASTTSGSATPTQAEAAIRTTAAARSPSQGRSSSSDSDSDSKPRNGGTIELANKSRDGDQELKEEDGDVLSSSSSSSSSGGFFETAAAASDELIDFVLAAGIAEEAEAEEDADADDMKQEEEEDEEGHVKRRRGTRRQRMIRLVPVGVRIDE